MENLQNTQNKEDNSITQIAVPLNLTQDFVGDEDDTSHVAHEDYNGDAKTDPLDLDKVEVNANENSIIREKKSPKSDTEIKQTSKSKGDSKNGSAITLPTHEPWPDEVNGHELLDDIVSIFKSYVALPDHAAETLALWVVHSYTYEASFHTPRLVFCSPEKRCGKSTSLNVLSCIVSKPLLASNITAPAMYRTIEAVGPTFLIDEADTFAKENEEMRGIINAGHARNGSVIRLVGKDFEPRQFSAWCPMVIAAIGNLPSTIEDRSIIIHMRRKLPTETVQRFGLDQIKSLDIIASKILRYTDDHIDELRQINPVMPQELNDRAADNWRPIFAIANLVAGEWPDRASKAALALSGVEAQQEQSAGVFLLEDLRNMFMNSIDRLPSNTICANLKELEERPWAQYGYSKKPLTPAQLAKLLKGYEIRPKDMRMGERNLKGYSLEQFKDAFARYLTPKELAATPATLVDPLDIP